MGYGLPLTLVGALIALFANVRHPDVALFGLGVLALGVVLIAAGVLGWRRTRKRYAKLFAEAQKSDEV